MIFMCKLTDRYKYGIFVVVIIMKIILDFIVIFFDCAFYISLVPGVALIWILPTIFLIFSLIQYKRETDNKSKYKKLLLISLIIFIVCILLFIGLVIWAISDFNNAYPAM